MKRSVCILDDDPHVAAVVARMIIARGFAAHEFTAPAPFLAEVKKSHPELIILDLALGRVDAIDIIRHLERLPYNGHVMLISGHAGDVLADAEQIGACHGLRMLPSLKKPFRIQQLDVALQILDRQTFAREARPAAPVTPTEALKVDLQDALGRGWLEVWYQPKIDLKSLAICGAEALVRMRHPVHGILPPAHFLPPASDPLHQRLAKAVLKRAMVDWQRFADSHAALKVAVNVPLSVIGSVEFVSFVRGVLPQDDRFPGLILEMTEDEVIGISQTIREVVTQLRLYNVTMSIHDFGSGHASLTRLTQVQLGELKLDGKFVRGCSSDRSKHSLCRSVIELGHGFGASICAEGLEDAADLRALIEMRCDIAQGFLFADPMPADEFIQFLKFSSSRFAGAGALEHDASLAARSLGRDAAMDANLAR